MSDRMILSGIFLLFAAYNIIKDGKESDMLLLSGDVMYGDVLIRTMGNREIEVENFKGIIDYDHTKVILQGKRQLIIISGESLMILSYLENVIRMQGIIYEIEFRV